MRLQVISSVSGLSLHIRKVNWWLLESVCSVRNIHVKDVIKYLGIKIFKKVIL